MIVSGCEAGPPSTCNSAFEPKIRTHGTEFWHLLGFQSVRKDVVAMPWALCFPCGGDAGYIITVLVTSTGAVDCREIGLWALGFWRRLLGNV